MVAIGALALLLVLAASTSSQRDLFVAPERDTQTAAPAEPEQEEEQDENQDEEDTPAQQTLPPEENRLLDTATWVIFGIVGAALLGAAVLAARSVKRQDQHAPREHGLDAGDPLPSPDAVIDREEELQTILRGGEPRNAIVACWSALEDAVGRAAGERPAWETSAELTERVLSAWDVPAPVIEDLAAAYREARFSRHDLGEADRERAIAALTQVQEHLRRRPSSDVAPQPQDAETRQGE